MFGVSTFCLHDQPLPSALERIAAISDFIEVMDEGLHYLEDPELLQSYSAKFTIHSPCRGTNIASLLEPIRRASVEVTGQCFAIAAEVNAGVVVHPGYFAWVEEREKAEKQCRKSIGELKCLSGEHGIGMAKSRYLEKETSRATILYSRRIKAALDPKNILNPGKIIGE